MLNFTHTSLAPGPYRARSFFLSLLVFMSAVIATIVCCGTPNRTPSQQPVEALPADWDGHADYTGSGWSFEKP